MMQSPWQVLQYSLLILLAKSGWFTLQVNLLLLANFQTQYYLIYKSLLFQRFKSSKQTKKNLNEQEKKIAQLNE